MSEEFWRSVWIKWQALIPEVQVAIRAAAVLVAAFVAARIAGFVTDRRLRAVHFDAALRRPWSAPPAGARADPHSLTPTRLVTLLVRLTVWGSAIWTFAYFHGWHELARGLAWLGGRVWALAAVILAALLLSRFLSEKLIEVVQSSPLRQKFEGWQPAPGRDQRLSGPAVLLGFVADAVVVLLALLVAADLGGLALAGQALSAAWQVVLHLFTAAVALLIGWVGARALRAESATEAGAVSTPAGFGSYAATSVMGGAVLLAILLLAGNFPTYFGLAILALVVMLVWPAQRWLPDIYAGVLLRMQRVKEVRIDGVACPVGVVGLVQTQLTHPDGIRSRRNRDVLDAHLAADAKPESRPTESR
jgi:hypothetical protein